MDIRRSGLGKSPPASFFDLPNARLIRKTHHSSGCNLTLYIVAVCKADQAIEIIRNEVAERDDEVEDLGRVAGSLVQALNLAPGEFVRVDGNYKPQGQSDRAETH